MQRTEQEQAGTQAQKPCGLYGDAVFLLEYMDCLAQQLFLTGRVCLQIMNVLLLPKTVDMIFLLHTHLANTTNDVF